MVMTEIECDHLPVPVGDHQRPGQNRYRVNCGHYISCGCRHDVGSTAHCLTCGEPRRITDSAISVWQAATGNYRCEYRHEERES